MEPQPMMQQQQQNIAQPAAQQMQQPAQEPNWKERAGSFLKANSGFAGRLMSGFQVSKADQLAEQSKRAQDKMAKLDQQALQGAQSMIDEYNKQKEQCVTSTNKLKGQIEATLQTMNRKLNDPAPIPLTMTQASHIDASEAGTQAPVQGDVALAPRAIENQPPAPNPEEATPNPQEATPNTQQAAVPLTDVQGAPDVVLKAKLSEYFQKQGVVDINGKSLDPEMIGRGISDLKFNDTKGFKSKFYINEAASQYKTAEQIIAEPGQELLNQIKTNALEIANGGMSTSLRGQGVSWGGKRKSKKSQKKQAKRKTCSGGKKNKSKKKNCSGGNKNKSKKQNCNGGKKSQRKQKK